MGILFWSVGARFAVCLGIAAALLHGSAEAQAPAQREIEAEALFQQAVTLMEQEKYEEASFLFKKSYARDHANGALFLLAECKEHLGQTATAYALYREVDLSDRANGEIARADEARRRAQKLEPKLCRLQIQGPAEDAIEGLEVRRNGALVGRLSLNAPVPVDPGNYTISAQAPSHYSWRTKVSVNKPGVTVLVTVPDLELTLEEKLRRDVACQWALTGIVGAGTALSFQIAGSYLFFNGIDKRNDPRAPIGGALLLTGHVLSGVAFLALRPKSTGLSPDVSIRVGPAPRGSIAGASVLWQF